jgi:hypothetical protein
MSQAWMPCQRVGSTILWFGFQKFNKEIAKRNLESEKLGITFMREFRYK